MVNLRDFSLASALFGLVTEYALITGESNNANDVSRLVVGTIQRHSEKVIAIADLLFLAKIAGNYLPNLSDLPVCKKKVQCQFVLCWRIVFDMLDVKAIQCWLLCFKKRIFKCLP